VLRRRANAASNSASPATNAQWWGPNPSASTYSRMTPLPSVTGTDRSRGGPVGTSRMPARKVADAHLLLAGMTMWLSSMLMPSGSG